MGKITLYILMVLIFLGLSRGFSTNEGKLYFIKNERVLSHFFHDGPLTVILIGSFSSGTFIKTYFHQYKVVYAFKQPELITVKISRQFSEKNEKNLGLSIFRESEEGDQSQIPMPPGALFIGDLAYGSWKHQNSGKKVWHFHLPYNHFYDLLGWKDFQPSFDFYNKMNIQLEQNKIFMGLNNEFGTDGMVSKNIILAKKPIIQGGMPQLKIYLRSLIRYNFKENQQ